MIVATRLNWPKSWQELLDRLREGRAVTYETCRPFAAKRLKHNSPGLLALLPGHG